MTFRARITTGIAATALIIGLAAADIPSDLNAIDPSIPAAATELPAATDTTSIDPRVATVPTSLEWRTGDCPSFFARAMAAGWTWNEWPRLGGVIMPRESGCDPGALNDNRNTYRCRVQRKCDWSFGLTQINTYGDLWDEPLGWLRSSGPLPSLRELCELTTRDQLYDVDVNLACARRLYDVHVLLYGNGWRPW